jgi:TRAP-type C4-dicarboxylate transport system permease small subunit
MNKRYIRFTIFPLVLIFTLVTFRLVLAEFNTVETTANQTSPSVETSKDVSTPQPPRSTTETPKGNVVQKNTFTIENPLKVNTVSDLIQEAIKIASYVAIILAVLALVYVGFLFVMSRGNTDKMQEYRTWLQYILIGVAIIIGARLIVSVVINTLEATGVVDNQVIQSAKSALPK